MIFYDVEVETTDDTTENYADVLEALQAVNTKLDTLTSLYYYTYEVDGSTVMVPVYPVMIQQMENLNESVVSFNDEFMDYKMQISSISRDVSSIKASVGSGTDSSTLSSIDNRIKYFQDKSIAADENGLLMVDGHGVTDGSLYASAHVENATTNDVYSMLLSIRNVGMIFAFFGVGYLLFKMFKNTITKVFRR